MSDYCCILSVLLLLLTGAAISAWLVALHRQVDRQVDSILASAKVAKVAHCDAQIQEDAEYSAGKALFQVVNVTSAGDCHKACQQALGCEAWTWGARRGVMGLSDVCFLRQLEPGQRPQAEPRPGVISGLVCPTEEARDGERLRGSSRAGGLAAVPRYQLAEDDSADDSLVATTTSAVSRSHILGTSKVSTRLGAAQSLYCFSLMLPGSYEEALVRIQHQQSASIFGCDGHAVYSNGSIQIGHDLVTKVVDSDLHCELGGEFNTAMNTAIFMAVWDKVNEDADFLNFDWTVKVDPDTVFFPARLRPVLAKHEEVPRYRKATKGSRGTEMDVLRCDLFGSVGDGSCTDSFQWSGGEKSLRECGAECSRYNNCKGIAWGQQGECVLLGRLAERPGDDAGWQQYEKEPSRGVYINNCKYGLHGPIEIFSSEAVTELVRGREKCKKHFNRGCGGECAWGEDLFIDQCLWKVLGIQRDDVFDLLQEAHCEPPEGWDKCTSEVHVAFHPFKDAEAYQICMDSASRSNGHDLPNDIVPTANVRKLLS